MCDSIDLHDKETKPSKHDHLENDKLDSLRFQTLENENLELKKKVEDLALQVERLENLQIDRDFENGIFVESEVLKKLEDENKKLRRILDEFYKTSLKEWLDIFRKDNLRQL